ncbi:MAG TPA: ABC transporter permease [Acidimicrobiales bacterium]|nr:ABC transporter permease [Acidimicrobiales bacterium]
MFHLTYIARELRRRLGRTILTSLGLALGVGLVIGIIGVSQGLNEAQANVLAPLKTVGTDILVTRVAGATPASTTGATTTTTATGNNNGAGQRGGGFFIGGAGGGPGGPNAAAVSQADLTALAQENSNVVTDLSKLGKPGEQFTHDFFLSATLISFPQEALDQVAKLPGVSSAVGGLVQLANHQTGTVPEIVANVQTGGETVDISPPTAAEQEQIRQCFESRRGQGGNATGGATAPAPAQGGTGNVQVGPDEGPGGAGGCLPERFQRFRTQQRTIQQAIDPPQTNITSTSYTAAGIDATQPKVGLVTNEQLTSGKWLSSNSANEVLANVAYANSKSLSVGGKIPINGTDYTIVGLVNPTLTGSTADLYFPLPKLQELASKAGRVTQVLVKADNAASVDKVAAAIKKILPDAEVVTTKSLATSVTGSLASAHDLAQNVGFAVAAIVLLAAFAIAALLTLSSISKRVREIGTLRAIGWSKGRVVKQLLGETMGIGVVGGVLGIVFGVALAAVVGITSPSLSATSGGVPGVGSSQLARQFGQTVATATSTHVKLSAPLKPSTLLLGIVFALVGGLLAGLIGSWRAARLAPSVALRDLG